MLKSVARFMFVRTGRGTGWDLFRACFWTVAIVVVLQALIFAAPVVTISVMVLALYACATYVVLRHVRRRG